MTAGGALPLFGIMALVVEEAWRIRVSTCYGKMSESGRLSVRLGEKTMRRLSVIALAVAGPLVASAAIDYAFLKSLLEIPSVSADASSVNRAVDLTRSWLEKTGRTVISVVHDLSLARAYGTRALLLQHGETVCFGKPAQVFSPENLRAVYGMDVYAYHREMLALWE